MNRGYSSQFILGIDLRHSQEAYVQLITDK